MAQCQGTTKDGKLCRQPLFKCKDCGKGGCRNPDCKNQMVSRTKRCLGCGSTSYGSA